MADTFSTLYWETQKIETLIGTLLETLCWIPRNLATLLGTLPRTLCEDTWSYTLAATTLFPDTLRNVKNTLFYTFNYFC